MSALELYSLKTELLHAIAEASDLDKLEEVRIAALGRKGRIPQLMQALGSLPPEERKAYGQVVDSLRTAVGNALEARRVELSKAAILMPPDAAMSDLTLSDVYSIIETDIASFDAPSNELFRVAETPSVAAIHQYVRQHGATGAVELRLGLLGSKGLLKRGLRNLGTLPQDRRKLVGFRLNLLNSCVAAFLNEEVHRSDRARIHTKLASERADVTLPVRLGPLAEGRIHPVSQVTDEITEIFADMGFSIAEGPDIETDFNNFTALNIPPEHPARQDHDTFYFPEAPDGSRAVLRTHTSPVQIRTMLANKPPLRIIAPGRVYRCDSDQTHTPMFHQVEGLVIDEETHLGHLKWVLEEFCKAFFELKQVKMRFRASHFPFTEPSMEVDIGYAKVGDEIRIGEGDQWLEILGCGMVHPNVLRNVGLDPARYQGFAFGLGIDRIAMLKYGMPDLRAFFAGDLRWLKHYGFPPLAIPTLAGGLS